MRKISKEKYAGWYLERMSLDNDLFTLDLARRWVRSNENIEVVGQRSRAKLIFTSTKKIVLSKFTSEAEIIRLNRDKDDDGNIVCVFECSPDSYVTIVAQKFTDLQY